MGLPDSDGGSESRGGASPARPRPLRGTVRHGRGRDGRFGPGPRFGASSAGGGIPTSRPGPRFGAEAEGRIQALREGAAVRSCGRGPQSGAAGGNPCRFPRSLRHSAAEAGGRGIEMRPSPSPGGSQEVPPSPPRRTVAAGAAQWTADARPPNPFRARHRPAPCRPAGEG
jgi:hypothetical protein